MHMHWAQQVLQLEELASIEHLQVPGAVPNTTHILIHLVLGKPMEAGGIVIPILQVRQLQQGDFKSFGQESPASENAGI